MSLLYLTPDGRAPEKENEIPANVHYTCISYRKHLTEWLRSCLSGLPPRLQEFLSPWAEVIADLKSDQELKTDSYE
jgi:hypothetical protein